MSEPAKWVDGLGRIWWQPQSNDGKALWVIRSYYETWNYLCPHYGKPKGYRSKNRAERVGRRRSKYLARTALTRIDMETRND